METTKHSTATFRFIRDLVAIGFCIALVAATAHASDTSADAGVAAKTKVATSTDRPGIPATRVKSVINGPVASKTRHQPQQSLYAGFEIFDVAVDLYFDDDHDGHFYGIDVIFDADTDYAEADVFARLYLSLEGGPWEHYHSTGVFTLFGNSSDDLFTVETELYSGYPTAYYDVLIELYDADTGEFVASLDADETDKLLALPLEDQQRDEPFLFLSELDSHHGGSGGTSLVILVLLTGLLARRIYQKTQLAKANVP